MAKARLIPDTYTNQIDTITTFQDFNDTSITLFD